MANRHLSRSLVLQTLFEWDFRGLDVENARKTLARNVEEFAPGSEKDTFGKTLLQNIISEQKTIDEIIEKAAPEWPIEKISLIDRNVLRIGIYELLFSDRGEVPPKVAINEAIEIGKSFGGESSGRFINGVLGAIYKEIGEPGKDETTKKRGEKESRKANFPVETLVGSVVYSTHQGETFLGLVHDIFGHWTLAKGHLKDGETDEEGVRRKILEEIGVEAILEEEIGNNEYIASDPKKGKIRKRVRYFLSKSEYKPLTVGESKGLDDAKWFPVSLAPELNFYEDILPVITKAVETLSKKS